jgi:hypothetical protein
LALPAVVILADGATVIEGIAEGVPAWIGFDVTIGIGERIREIYPLNAALALIRPPLSHFTGFIQTV